MQERELFKIVRVASLHSKRKGFFDGRVRKGDVCYAYQPDPTRCPCSWALVATIDNKLFRTTFLNESDLEFIGCMVKYG